MLATVRLQYVLGHDVSSRAIAWFSSGHFSHVDALLDDERLLGSRSDTIYDPASHEWIEPGVRIRPPNYAPWKRRVIASIEVEARQATNWWYFLVSQIGKPYDMRAIMGFGFGRDWRSSEAWFCSELQARALEVAGIVRKLYVPINKITPVASALVMSAAGAKFTEMPV